MVGVGILLVWLIFANNFLGSSGMWRSLMESFNPVKPAPWCPDGVGANFGSTCDEVKDGAIATLENRPQSPEQCAKDSTYSGSDGCVILSNEQKMFLGSRGGNRTMEMVD